MNTADSTGNNSTKDKGALNVILWLMALVIAVIGAVVWMTASKNKYMLLPSAESTMENSIYCSSDLEIGIGGVDYENDEIELIAFNKTEKPMSIDLEQLTLNGIETNASMNATVDPESYASAFIKSSELRTTLKGIEKMGIDLMIDKSHELNLTLSVEVVKSDTSEE